MTVELILGSMSIAIISNYYCFMFCDIIIYFNNLRETICVFFPHNIVAATKIL